MRKKTKAVLYVLEESIKSLLLNGIIYHEIMIKYTVSTAAY